MSSRSRFSGRCPSSFSSLLLRSFFLDVELRFRWLAGESTVNMRQIHEGRRVNLWQIHGGRRARRCASTAGVGGYAGSERVAAEERDAEPRQRPPCSGRPHHALQPGASRPTATAARRRLRTTHCRPHLPDQATSSAGIPLPSFAAIDPPTMEARHRPSRRFWDDEHVERGCYSGHHQRVNSDG